MNLIKLLLLFVLFCARVGSINIISGDNCVHYTFWVYFRLDSILRVAF